MGIVSSKRLFIKKRVTLLGVARFCFSGFLFLSAAVIYAADTSIPLKQNPQTNQPKQDIVKGKPPSNKQIGIDKSLAYIQAIAQTGAVGLALLNLNKQQPKYLDAPERWLLWERERISLLTTSGQYVELVERLDNLPSGIERSFEYWAKTQQALAYLKLQAYSKTRQTVSSMIWGEKNIDFEFSNKWLPHWRRIIIQSYLNEGRIKDAHIAITRFRQDHGQADIGDIILYARILLMNNLVDEALSLLAKHTRNPEAGMLHLLAQLRKGVRSPRIVLQAGLRQMQGDWVQPELKIYLWSIVAEAAQRSEDRFTGIKAMEFILADSAKQRQRLPKGLFKLSVDDLWNAYVENAIYIGNKNQYLMGDDPAWLNAARKFDDNQAINARSMYAFLISRGQDKKNKQLAIKLFLKSLIRMPNGKGLISQLFLNSNKFKTKKSIPIIARYFLVDDALENKNINLASDLMASINESPKGADKFVWSLRRARVLVMGGKTKHSASALIELLNQQENISDDAIDKLMQVVFDLQTVKAYEQAYRVFDKILLHVKGVKRQREIYYWMADAKKAQKQYAKAASLYLKSALLPESGALGELNGLDTNLDANLDASLDASLDPWGQTARYQAASSLAKAGLISDARALYLKLLDATKDESRIKVLKHELQQLWLLENKFTE